MTMLASSDFEKYVAQQTAKNQPVVFDQMIFCNISGLTADKLQNYLTMPTEIVHRVDISRAGYIDENKVVYSAVLGSNVGDFEFNYIGLINKSENILAVACFTDTIKKRKNKGKTYGNSMSRNIILHFSGAKALTQINVAAESWQVDFTNEFVTINNKLDYLSSPAGFGMIGQCESIAQLRTIEPTEHNQRILVRGYYAGSNVGGGEFYADFNDKTTTDNAGTVIVTTGGKHWKRVISDDKIIIEWFGVTNEDGSTAINRALAIAKEQKSTNIVAQGDFYKIKNRLNFFGNTHINFNHATLNKDFIKDPATNASSLTFFSTDFGNENLTIENAVVKMNGHLLKGNTVAGFGGANFFGATNIKNLIIRNIEVHDIKNVHAIDLGNYENVLIENCRFLGAYHEDGEDVQGRYFSEAIQLESQAQNSNHNETGTRAVIRNCYFGASENSPAWMSGVGNHGGYDKALAPHKVLIEACVFDGMTYAGVRTFGAWEEVKVINNHFDKISGAGFVATNRDAWIDHHGSVDNLIVSGNSFKNHTGYACVSLLRNLQNNNAGDNALAKNVVISNNTFESSRSAVYLFGGKNITVANNSSTGADFINGVELKQVIISNNNIDVIKPNTTAIYVRKVENKDTGITIENEHITIEGNIIKGARRSIHVQAVNHVDIKNNMMLYRVLNDSDNAKSVPVIAVDSGSKQVSITSNTYSDNQEYDNSYNGLSVSYVDKKTLIEDNNLAGMRCHASNALNSGKVVMTARGEPEGIVTAPNNAIYYDTNNGLMYVRRASENGANGWTKINDMITPVELYALLADLPTKVKTSSNLEIINTSAPIMVLDNGKRRAYVQISASNNLGVWDATNSKWLYYSNFSDGLMQLGLEPALTANGAEVITARWFNSRFSQSLNENGWERMPSGRIMQWATYNANAGNTFNFPIAFNRACFAVIPVDYNTTGGNIVDITATNKTLTSFQILTQGGDVGLFSILAIGV